MNECPVGSRIDVRFTKPTSDGNGREEYLFAFEARDEDATVGIELSHELADDESGPFLRKVPTGRHGFRVDAENLRIVESTFTSQLPTVIDEQLRAENEMLRALLQQVQMELGVVRENEAICVDRALDLIDQSGLLDGGQ